MQRKEITKVYLLYSFRLYLGYIIYMTALIDCCIQFHVLLFILTYLIEHDVQINKTSIFKQCAFIYDIHYFSRVRN